MRRLWAASSAVLSCLALGGMPVAAQADAVTVTATQECVLGSSTITCTYTASDPRVAGTASFPGGHHPGVARLRSELAGEVAVTPESHRRRAQPNTERTLHAIP